MRKGEEIEPVVLSRTQRLWWLSLIAREAPLLGADAIVNGGMVVYARFQQDPAHQEAEEKGLGAVAVEGRMVDRATVRLAKQLYEQAKYLKLV